MIKSIIKILVLPLVLCACQNPLAGPKAQEDQWEKNDPDHKQLTEDVKNETLRTWQAYKKYAWGHDVLKPLSGTYHDWYKESLHISPIDAYSTLKIMGLDREAQEVERYVADSVDFNKDVEVKVFEVNIRILGGLLSMYELSGNSAILCKAEDFGMRMLSAFQTETGIPRYWINLRTGVSRGDTVNVAEAGTYLIELGILSYHTHNPVYYRVAKKAMQAIYERRSDLGLIGDVIDVQSGEWVSGVSHICAGVDSYYEYLYKAYLLFNDPELLNMWENSMQAVHHYIADDFLDKLWYGRVDMYTGERVSDVVTLYDAFFPAALALSEDIERAEKLQETWDWLWNKYGLEPMAYDYRNAEPTYPAYDLNPEIIESAYYLYHFTGDQKYFDMAVRYWSDLNKYCKTSSAYTSVKDVRTMEQKDYMPTFFLAETLKYLYLVFSYHSGSFDFEKHIFNTEAHPFKRMFMTEENRKKWLGISVQ